MELLVRLTTAYRLGSLTRCAVQAVLDLLGQEDAINLATPQIGLRDDHRIPGVLEARNSAEFEVESVSLGERSGFVDSDPA